ncbi:MAG: glutamine-hydrolyzing GMP synthase [Ignavibacterium sp.]|nr:glutamine-hydrolyzing GMP synthase [Ignavibacterium sp.]MCX7611212.1 glutamine-hydrolyzing GMP synthase [Ignavibacterium sp.]MDW8376027.1 glutamine-hydrolyzing GMP synthase [Ignavibacteriales bacterium]
MLHKEIILIIDFGSQFTQLITRRVRESKVYSEIFPHTITVESIKNIKPKGIILSGGPMSVYDQDAPSVSKEIFDLNIPILGICYGLQFISKELGGKVEGSFDREYGRTKFNIIKNSKLTEGIPNQSIVWMSHGDIVKSPPEGFEIIGTSEHSPICAIENLDKNIYGVQFHPEVYHTEFGDRLIKNFLFNICKCEADWTPSNFISSSIEEIKNKVGNSKAICALSGGVDSTVAAVLVKKAIGENLHCIHIDTGLMRKNESQQIEKLFSSQLDLNVKYVNASQIFLQRLKNITDPEQKRKIIGNTFIEIFEQESKKIEDVEFLVQGTLYPDVIESVSVKGKSATIKTHHNVGGLPEKMNLKLIEPFRELFKDEVRKVGYELGIPEDFIMRHPFPGPGLAVRILGEVTEDRIKILQEADDIFISELKRENLYNKIWQAFAVLLPVQSVGVMGDARTYENVLALRAVTSVDGMTADWYPFENEFLAKVSNLIINKVNGVNRVVYDISSKPPSTIEWE